MTEVTFAAPGWLETATQARLERRLVRGLKNAREKGTVTLVSVSAPWPAGSDPTALVVRSRRAGEPWFVLEQPGRDQAALAALGCVRELSAHGQDRFRDVDRAGRGLARDVIADAMIGPPGSGLVAVG